MQGDGTWQQPFLIHNIDDFMEFYLTNQTGQWYRLENSIDLRIIKWFNIFDNVEGYNKKPTLNANLDMNGYFIACPPNKIFDKGIESNSGIWQNIKNSTIINGGFVKASLFYDNTILAAKITNSVLANLYFQTDTDLLQNINSTTWSELIAFEILNSSITNTSMLVASLQEDGQQIYVQPAKTMLNSTINNLCLVGINKNKTQLQFSVPNFTNTIESTTHWKNIYYINGTAEDGKYHSSYGSNTTHVKFNQLTIETFNKLPTNEMFPNTPIWIVENGKFPKLGILDYETFFVGLDSGWWTYDPILKECSKVANAGEENIPNSGGIPKGWINLLTTADWNIIKQNGTLQSIARVNRNPNNNRVVAKETTIQPQKTDNVFTFNLDWNQIGSPPISLGVDYA